MKTIERYEKLETSMLQNLLEDFETLLEENELKMDVKKSKNENCDDMKKVSDDYEIDISLIRMELNKRLWFDDF